MKRSLIFLALFFLLALPVSVLAQQQNPPVDPNSMWGEVVDQNGNILYSNMTDLGTVQQSASWMPSIPGIGNIQASYHEYQTPSGNIVVLPTASTLLFMALNPQASGMAQADSQLGLGAGTVLEAPGIIKGLLQGYIDPATITGLGYTNPDDFFSDVASGKQNIWTFGGWDMTRFLYDLYTGSVQDKSIYTMLLLYTPGDCSKIPGGCPANANLPSPSVPSSCSTPIVTSGAITVTAHKVAPLNPIVVGQDPEKRGADVTWEVRVDPTSYTYGVKVPVMGNVCVAGSGTSNCTTSNNQEGTLQQVVVGYNCVQHTKLFPEGLNWATPFASLSQTSRDWILNTLSLHYPKAFLHNPSFSFRGDLASGALQGNTFVWILSQSHIQVADPGYFDLGVSGSTSGTPVSSPRGFSRNGGQFGVYLMESVIIQ